LSPWKASAPVTARSVNEGRNADRLGGAISLTAKTPIDEAAAIAWLRDQGRVGGDRLGPGAHFGLGAVQRRLAKWAAEDYLAREVLPGGASVITVCAPAQPVARPPAQHSDHSDSTGENLPVTTEAAHLPARILRTSVDGVTIAGDQRLLAHAPKLPGRRAVVLPIILMATALGLGATGPIINARFAASFGATSEAAVLLAAIGVALDVLAIVLPATAAQLWNRGRRLFAVIAWALWPAVLLMTLLAGASFAAGNLGDQIAGRARTAEAAVGLRQDLGRLRQERAGIAEQRSVAEIAVAIARMQVPDWVWRDTRQCAVVDSAEGRKACGVVLPLGRAEATAQRCDHLDAEVTSMGTRLVAGGGRGADPASIAAELVSWIMAGTVAPSPRDIYRLRVAGLVLAPSISGSCRSWPWRPARRS
jgi:hypothetical protein